MTVAQQGVIIFAQYMHILLESWKSTNGVNENIYHFRSTESLSYGVSYFSAFDMSV